MVVVVVTCSGSGGGGDGGGQNIFNERLDVYFHCYTNCFLIARYQNITAFDD